MTDPHDIVVSHVPLDGPGVRLAGAVAGVDVSLSSLHEARAMIEKSLTGTEAALESPELRELAMAVRGALVASNTIIEHLAAVHRGIIKGNLNYTEDANVVYDGHTGSV